MKMTYIYVGLIVLAAAAVVFVRSSSNPVREEQATEFDAFAQCLADAGAIFYGSYLCSHCQDQKRMFNNSTKLPYVECALPGGRAFTEECRDLEITATPTWIFADGSRLEGRRELSELGEKTSCEVPAATTE